LVLFFKKEHSFFCAKDYDANLAGMAIDGILVTELLRVYRAG
jgi:hypothetical protein